MVKPTIAISGANKWFGALHVLRDVSFEVAEGHVVVICGPSGSGKSTLLRCMNGLERVQSGVVRVMDRELDERALRTPDFVANIGMVFQRFSLYPHMRVLANLTLAPRKVRGLSRSDG